MTDLTPTEVNALLEEVQERRDQFTAAVAAVELEDTHPDDFYLEVCKRLGIELLPPRTHADDMGTHWCDFCSVVVLLADKHERWHLRVQAATKLSYWLSELTFKHTALLGLTLTQALSVLVETIDAEEEAETPAPPWTGSGHGHIYPAGDPPGSMRARCGGPAMCQKCRADEQHSLTAGDGYAEAFRAALQKDERDRPRG